MDSSAPHVTKSGNPLSGHDDGSGGGNSNVEPRTNSINNDQKPSIILAPQRQYMSPTASGIGSVMREREHSVGAWSISSVGTGDSRGTPSPSVTRSASRRKGKAGTAGRSGLSAPAMRKKKDKHSLALRSIREFLKGRSCYDCLPVSFRLVVLDTKLIVKPALDIMWQAGVVSAPLWQSSTEPTPSSSLNDKPSAAASSSLASDSSLEPTASPSQNDDQQRRNLANSPSPVPSAPTNRTGFAGMFTVNDIIHLIQYYYQNSSYDNASQDVERFRLEMLREIEQSLDVPPPPLLSIDPLRPIFDACQLLMKTHARRLPLLDHDEQTGMDVVVSVLTQYRVLKFIAMNCRETAGLNRSIRSLKIGTYIASMRTGMTRSMTMSSAISSSRRSSNAAVQNTLSPVPFSETSAISTDPATSSINTSSRVDSPALDDNVSRRSSNANALEPLATATLDTTVFDVVHIFSEKGISGIPILDEEGYVVDLYETVDVIDLVRTNAYQSLDLTIRQALNRRSKEFPGVVTCSPDDSLATIFALLRSRRVHRILILEPENDGSTVQQGPSGAITIETDKAMQAAIASDVGAIGDNKSGEEPQKRSGKGEVGEGGQQKDNNGFLGEIPRRKRGKLVGILCLSDIMRYIIGETSDQNSNAPSMRAGQGGGLDSATNATTSTTVSSVDQNEFPGGFMRPRQGSEEVGIVSDAGSLTNTEGLPTDSTTSFTGLSTQTPAARFDPNDMPPTIEEHVELNTPPPPTPLSLPEDQTPTQEKSVESAVSGTSSGDHQ